MRAIEFFFQLQPLEVCVNKCSTQALGRPFRQHRSEHDRCQPLGQFGQPRPPLVRTKSINSLVVDGWDLLLLSQVIHNTINSVSNLVVDGWELLLLIKRERERATQRM